MILNICVCVCLCVKSACLESVCEGKEAALKSVCEQLKQREESWIKQREELDTHHTHLINELHCKAQVHTHLFNEIPE